MYLSSFLSCIVSGELFYLHSNRSQTHEGSSSRRSILPLGIHNPYRRWSSENIFWGWVCINRTFRQHHVYRHNKVHIDNLYYHRKFHRGKVWAYNSLSLQNCKGHHQHSNNPLCMGCGPFYMDCLRIRFHEEDNPLQKVNKFY